MYFAFEMYFKNACILHLKLFKFQKYFVFWFLKLMYFALKMDFPMYFAQLWSNWNLEVWLLKLSASKDVSHFFVNKIELQFQPVGWVACPFFFAFVRKMAQNKRFRCFTCSRSLMALAKKGKSHSISYYKVPC